VHIGRFRGWLSIHEIVIARDSTGIEQYPVYRKRVDSIRVWLASSLWTLYGVP